MNESHPVRTFSLLGLVLAWQIGCQSIAPSSAVGAADDRPAPSTREITVGIGQIVTQRFNAPDYIHDALKWSVEGLPAGWTQRIVNGGKATVVSGYQPMGTKASALHMVISGSLNTTEHAGPVTLIVHGEPFDQTIANPPRVVSNLNTVAVYQVDFGRPFFQWQDRVPSVTVEVDTSGLQDGDWIELKLEGLSLKQEYHLAGSSAEGTIEAPEKFVIGNRTDAAVIERGVLVVEAHNGNIHTAEGIVHSIRLRVQ